MSIKIENNNGTLAVYTPYSSEFVSDLKESLSDRKWDGSLKAWLIPETCLDVVERLLSEHFGYKAGATGGTVIQITAKESMIAGRDSVRCANIPVAKASGRDSGAYVCEDVALISGSINSGGSVKNWTTTVREGSVFRISNFPEFSIAKIDSDAWEYEIITEKSTKEKLESEKEELLKRLAEIEKELETL